MITPVNFELAKLLKEKGFDKPTLNWYHKETKKFNTNDLMFSMNKLTDNYSAPTIAQVVMWLYEKHGIWVSVLPYNDEELNQTLWENKVINISDDYNDCSDYTFYHSPTEAYEAAFEYCLNSLI